MTTAKAKAAKADDKDEAAVEEKPAKKDEAPEVTTEVTWNGMTAFDTIDGVVQPARTATLVEQLPLVANELLSLVVGSVPYASSGGIEVDGTTLTITLTSH